jgi:hypothetical protein
MGEKASPYGGTTIYYPRNWELGSDFPKLPSFREIEPAKHPCTLLRRRMKSLLVGAQWRSEGRLGV